MSGNNNNENLSWKNKLDELESLPGETFHLNASWEKLHARRGQVSIKKRAFWYWLAAACIVAVISFPWFFNKGNNTLPLVKISAPLEKKQFLPAADPVKVIADSGGENKAVAVAVKKAPLQLKPVSPDTMLTALHSEEIAAEQLVITDTLKLVEAAPVKKKLKLVHFNELNNLPENIADGQDMGKPFFPVKFRSKEIYTNNSAGSGNGKDNLIRIKLSSQN